MNTHVDLAVLSTLRDVMETEYPALLHIFIKDSEARVTDLYGLIHDPDFSPASPDQLQTLRSMAHSFKGSSGNMGASHLADLCHQLEELVRDQGVVSGARILELVRAIHAEFNVVRDFFDVELQSTLTRH